jgi:murein DD-endopeptidase MepM/ murein hydrolase activator NlpD
VKRTRSLAFLVLGATVAGCDARARVEAFLDTRTPRERYEAALTLAGLDSSALVADWRASAERALADAPVVTAPHVEEGVLGRAAVGAFAFRVNVRRGQEVSFTMQLHGDATALVFLDVFEVDSLSPTGLRRVEVADSGRRSVTVEPRRGGEYVFRAQPELLRGGRFTLRIGLAPTLAFPVKGADTRAIRSAFGAPRDGGARRHDGIDIFARRGTPVVAAAAGVVSRTGNSGRGGNTVWLRDYRGNSQYYAHLDRHAVLDGQNVNLGDTLGFVGNTGNARTTPPHLHFGVYRRGEGPMDPRWFVTPVLTAAQRLRADTTLLGASARTTREAAVLRSPRAASTGATMIPRDTEVRVLSAVGVHYRVRFTDGRTGYVLAEVLKRAPDVAN